MGYPYIPSFQAQEPAVKFWSEPEVRGFLFCNPNEMLLLRKDLFFFFFFLHKTFLKNIFSNHSKLPTSLKDMKNGNKQQKISSVCLSGQ